jgi:hypothetical protein
MIGTLILEEGGVAKFFSPLLPPPLSLQAVLSIVEAKSSVGVDKAAESKGGRPPSGQAPQVDAAALKMLDQLPQARALCYRSVFGQLD